MKKIVLALAVVFSVALVSCGDKKAEATDTVAADSVEVAVVEEVDSVVDSLGDTAVVEAAAAEVAEVPAN